MGHSSVFPQLRLQRYPRWILPGLVALLFSLLGVAFPNYRSSAQAVKQPVQIGYSISGTVFKDDNQDGTQSATELGINGIVVTAYTLRGATLTTSTTKSISTLNGKYILSIPPGIGPIFVRFSNFGPRSSIAELKSLHATNHANGAAIRFVAGTQPSNTLNLGLVEDSPVAHATTYFKPKLINPSITDKRYNFTTTRANTGYTVVKQPFQKHARLRVTTQPTFQAGQSISYSIIVSNSSSAGPVLAGDSITISDSIPIGLTNLTVSPNSDWTTTLSATTSPATLTATYVGTYPVASGATMSTITLSGTLTSNTVPSLSNTATVTTPNDSNVNNNSGTSTATILAQPDLAITETVPTNVTFQVGHTADFTLSVSNVSTTGSVQPGSPITVTDTIPTGLTGMTVTANSDWTIALNSTTSPTTLTATYAGTLPVNPGTTLSPIVLHGTLTTAARPTLTNPANVSTPYDSNPANDNTSAQISVQPQPDMTIAESIPTGVTFQVGHTVTFTITGSDLNTAGPVITGDPITITSAIPAGLTGLTTSPNSDWTVAFDTTTSPSTMTATYVGAYPVTPGTPLSPILLTGTLTTAALPSLTNPVTVTTPNDSNHANDSTSVVVPVRPQPDMTITESIPTGVTFQVGHTVTFTITGSDLNTAGPVITGDPITITSAIPAGLTGLTTSPNSDWTVAFDTTTSPATMTATYVGAYPVTPGTSLSSILLTGTLTTAARPTLTNPVTVTTPNDSNHANDSTSVQVPVQPQPDMTITETVPSGVTFQVGHTVTFTITGSDLNTAGPVITGDPITITSAIPTGLTGLTTGPNSDWLITFDTTTSPATMTATYVGTYPVTPGTSLSSILLTGTLTTAAIPSLTNPVTVTTPNDSNHANDSTSVVVPVQPQPDLSLSKTVQAVAPQLQKGQASRLFQKGEEVNYTIEVSNATIAGPVAAGSPIVVTDNIPVGLTNLVATSNNDWQVTLSQTTSPTTLTATYVGPYPIPQGTKLSAIALRGTLTGDVVQLTNTATVSTPNNNTASKNKHTSSTTVAIAVDLAITKTHFGPDTFSPGQTIHYQLTVHSTTTSETIPPGTSIKVIDVLPAGFDQVHASGRDWRITISRRGRSMVVVAVYSGYYPITHGHWLAPIMISARVKGKAGRIVNTASVTMPYDSNPSNNKSGDAIMLRVPALPPTGSDPNALHTRHYALREERRWR